MIRNALAVFGLVAAFMACPAQAAPEASVFLATSTVKASNCSGDCVQLQIDSPSELLGVSLGYFYTAMPVDVGVEAFMSLPESGAQASIRKTFGPVRVAASAGIIQQAITLDGIYRHDAQAPLYGLSLGYVVDRESSFFVTYAMSKVDRHIDGAVRDGGTLRHVSLDLTTEKRHIFAGYRLTF